MRNSQIGQLLFYLVTIQLKKIKLYLDPAKRCHNYKAPNDVMGIFMEQGKVNYSVIFYDCLELSLHMQVLLLWFCSLPLV